MLQRNMIVRWEKMIEMKYYMMKPHHRKRQPTFRWTFMNVYILFSMLVSFLPTVELASSDLPKADLKWLAT